MASYGALCYGPILHAWYAAMERFVSSSSARGTACKVVLSQVLLKPLLLVLVFAYNAAWTGRLRSLPDKCRRDLWPTMVAGWRFWVPASTANFALVPLHSRVLFSSACSLFWNTYVSMSAARA
eukprot:SM002662S09958  [mRNA]  locus=s2662:983:1464:- [translate_table: standard]